LPKLASVSTIDKLCYTVSERQFNIPTAKSLLSASLQKDEKYSFLTAHSRELCWTFN